MKFKQILISESGTELSHATEGVILYGCMFKSELGPEGHPQKGIIGDGPTMELMLKNKIEGRAYSNKEIIKALGIPAEEIIKIGEELKERPRTTSDNGLDIGDKISYN